MFSKVVLPGFCFILCVALAYANIYLTQEVSLPVDLESLNDLDD